MNSFLRNTISKFCNTVSAPVAATRDALAERLQSVHDTASLFYNSMMENMKYGQERLKDIVEKEAEEEKSAAAKEKKKKPSSNGKDQQQPKNNKRMMMMMMMMMMMKMMMMMMMSDMKRLEK